MIGWAEQAQQIVSGGSSALRSAAVDDGEQLVEVMVLRLTMVLGMVTPADRPGTAPWMCWRIGKADPE